MNNGVNNTVCPNCGASILNGATFCGNCGYNLNNNIGVVNNVINSMPSEPPKNNKFQDKKKLLIIIGVVLVVLVGGFIAFKVLNHSSNKTKMFSDDQLIPIKKDSKYGYINTDGKIVIEPIYLDVSEFYGDYAVVEKEEDKSQIIDKNGKVVIDSSYNPEYFEDLEVWLIKSSLYDKNLKQISGDGYKIYHIEDNYFQWNDRESKTVGIMNEKGKILYKYTFQSDENFMSIDSSDKDEDLKDLYCVVNIENKKYGIVNCKNGKLVYDFGDKKIFSNGDNTFKIYNSSMSEVLDNIFINNDKVLYHSNGKNVGLTYRNGYLHINDYSNYQTSYLDIKTGKIVDKVDNTTTVELSDWEKKNDMTVYECETGVGLKSKDKVVVDCVWDTIRIFDYPVYDYLVSKNKKYIITKKDDSYYLVDLKNSKTIKEFKTKRFRNSNNSPFIFYDDENDNYVIYNVVTDKEVTVKNDVDIWLRSNYVIVEEDNKYNYYNSDLKLIYTASEK